MQIPMLRRFWIKIRAKYLVWYWSRSSKKIPPPSSPIPVPAKLQVIPPKPIEDLGFSPVDWIISALQNANLHPDPERELRLLAALSKWKHARRPLPWRAWCGSHGPHASKRRFVEYSPGMFRRVA